MVKYTLHKEERLCSKILIDRMFEGKSKSFPVFPLRVVYMPMEKKEKASASILVSVGKRKFKRAVKRNNVKRLIREAYRKNKYILLDVLETKETGLAISFIYLSDEIMSMSVIEEKMKIALTRITENME